MNERSQAVMRDFIFDALFQLVGEPGTLQSCHRFELKKKIGAGHCEAEGKIQYSLPSCRCLHHASDILISLPHKQICVEVKFRSANAEQFKSHAYDMANLKKSLGAKFLGIMVYIHAPGPGIPLDLARDYCYSFDHFIGREARGLDDLKALETVAAEIRQCIIAQVNSRVAAAAK